MKKVGMYGIDCAAAMIMVVLIVLQQLVEVVGKTPTLEYGIIRNAPPSSSMHPSPLNDPSRGCNAENYCRHFTLSAENPKNSSGTRVKAFAIVDIGAPLNNTAPGLEAITDGIATWYVNNTNFGRLNVSINATADADLAPQLKAIHRGIARKGLVVQYRSGSMSSEEMAALSSANGSIAITVGPASNHVDLKFMTHVERFGETDVIWILDYAKAKILSGGQ